MDVVTKIMHRLPPAWIPKWRKMDRIMYVIDCDISTKDLAEFVRRKAQECTNLSPIPTSHKSASNFEKSASRKATTFSTQVKRTNNTISTRNVTFPFCRQDHYLTQCKEFRELSYQARLDFVNHHKLCKACLKEEHLATTCNRRHEACMKQGSKQFHTALLYRPDNTKADAGFKDTRIGKSKASLASKKAVTNALIKYFTGGAKLPVVTVKIRISGSSKL